MGSSYSPAGRRTRRRQALTFTAVFLAVVLVAVGALGNWLQWWNIGPAPAERPPCPEQTVSAADQVKVNVFNATARRGLAAAVAKELKRRRFRVQIVGNHSSTGVIATAVSLRYGRGDEILARTVALQFSGEVRMLPEKAARDEHSVDVVIGGRYRAMKDREQAAAAIAAVPTPAGCRPAGSPGA
ncbi:LytR C-terminal domain-containing protein [Kineosporia babensis]|uniref:LytR C-terminal domain-containing protein n=1 Tax=Kineosporia babensis TaxID=499548 RepID=A0A9X1NN39_9ACTN|nr:LytR C-terminal domain-containing protein [Kineosporia babensis]MCD5316771.1 LytR C-terminal domain-containing protein [Kineosporia babensis]